MSERDIRKTSWRPSAVGAATGGFIGLLARDLDLRTLVSYWHDVHVGIALAAVAGALLWNTRLRVLLAAAALALSTAWLIVAFTPLSPRLADGLVRRDPLQPADAVFVLASRIQDDGEMTSTAMTRLLHGIELIAQGHAPRLVLSELAPPSPTYAAPARALMEKLGVETELLTVGPVGNTHDEAREVGRVYRERGWRRILVVTTPLHSKRACAAFEREGMTVVSSPSVETRYDLEQLRRPGERLLAFSGAIHERVGLFVYERRGWIHKDASTR